METNEQNSDIAKMLTANMQEENEEVSKNEEISVSDEGGEEVDSEEGEETLPDSDETDPEEDPGGDESEPDELTRLKEQNEKLQNQLNEAYAQTAEKAPSMIPSKEFTEEMFKDLDFDEIFENPDQFKKVLLDVANTVRRQTEEALYKNLPQVVGNVTGQQLELRKAADTFYDKNPELASVKPYVAKVTAQVADKHPDWSFEQILAETAKVARKGLGLEGLAKEEAKKKTKAKQKPAFADAKRRSNKRSKAGSDLSELEQEISELLEV